MTPVSLQSEDELLTVFEDRAVADGLLSSGNGKVLKLVREVEGLHGRVDLMAALVPNGFSLTTAQIEVCEQPSCAAILEALLNRQPKTASELASELRLHSTTIRRWLNRLVEEDLVRSVKNGYVLSPSGKTPRVLIWSFEGKLRNWKRALYQATRYRAFSHRSFVVMPEQCIGPALENLARFKRAKIGLIGVDDDGTITVHSRPPHRLPRSSIYHRVAGVKVLQAV